MAAFLLCTERITSLARPVTIRGGKIRVLLGNDASPQVFTAPCGLSQRSITLSKGMNESQIPSCENPDEVTWIGRDASSLSIAISGEGVLAAESLPTWLEAWEDIESVDVRVEVEFPATTYVWNGKMHVESLEIGANNGERATISVSMQSDGEMVRTSDAVAAPTNSLLPSISGVAQQDVVLTANNGGWGGAPTSFTYQWQEDDGGWGNIAGATGKTFTPLLANVGNPLRVVVTAINSAGSTSATSAATADVLAA